LYERFLGRSADSNGRAFFVSSLQGGGTLEGVTRTLLGSPEYTTYFPDVTSYVKSLYQNLLHRTGSDADVAGWVALLPQVGRTAVAQGFLGSPEYRGIEVTGYYKNLLQRISPPPAGDVASWASTPFDLLAVEAIFAALPEFQING